WPFWHGKRADGHGRARRAQHLAQLVSGRALALRPRRSPPAPGRCEQRNRRPRRGAGGGLPPAAAPGPGAGPLPHLPRADSQRPQARQRGHPPRCAATPARPPAHAGGRRRRLRPRPRPPRPRWQAHHQGRGPAQHRRARANAARPPAPGVGARPGPAHLGRIVAAGRAGARFSGR
nr:hypothetical protein [Tanacetum cinerariifolium]